MKDLLVYKNKKYCDFDLIEALGQIGIKEGDILCVHSELFNFGIPLLKKHEFLQSIIDCFFTVIGKEGTLIMPSFSYSFCRNEVYDKLNSKTKVGALNEHFRKWGGGFRTNDPIFSFVIKGAKQDLFLRDTSSCFGSNCVYDVLVRESGKYMLFGSTTGHTLIHHIEEKYGVEYRYFKNFSGILIDERGKRYSKHILFYVRRLDRHSLPNLDSINRITKQSKFFSCLDFAGAQICIFNALEYQSIAIQALKKQEDIFIVKEH